MVDCLGEPRVRSGAGQGASSAEVVQCPEDVITPPAGMDKGQELLIGRLTGAETTKEAALEKIFLTRLARLPRLRRPPLEVGRTQAASAGARNIVTVFDCDVDVKTGGRPRARSERRRAAAS